MATSVTGAFQQFKSNLEISSLQESTTSTRQQIVRDAIGNVEPELFERLWFADAMR